VVTGAGIAERPSASFDANCPANHKTWKGTLLASLPLGVTT